MGDGTPREHPARARRPWRSTDGAKGGSRALARARPRALCDEWRGRWTALSTRSLGALASDLAVRPRVCGAGRLVRTGKEEFRLLGPAESCRATLRLAHSRGSRRSCPTRARPLAGARPPPAAFRPPRSSSPLSSRSRVRLRPSPSPGRISPPLTAADPPPFALASQPRTSSPRSRTRRTRWRRSAPPRTCAASAGRCTSPSATRDSTAAGSSRCTSSSTSGSRARR